MRILTVVNRWPLMLWPLSAPRVPLPTLFARTRIFHTHCLSLLATMMSLRKAQLWPWSAKTCLQSLVSIASNQRYAVIIKFIFRLTLSTAFDNTSASFPISDDSCNALRDLSVPLVGTPYLGMIAHPPGVVDVLHIGTDAPSYSSFL